MGLLGQFATELYDCDSIFDLFACGFNHISTYLDTRHNDGLESENARIQALSRVIERADGNIPEDIWSYLDIPGDENHLIGGPFLRRILVALLSIDRACSSLNYHSGFQDRRLWNRVAVELERNEHKLNRGRRRVVLKPRRRFPNDSTSWWQRGLTGGAFEEIEARGEHWADEFVNLCRVPEVNGCILIHRVLPQRLELSDVSWSDLRIGMVPLVEDMDIGENSARLTPGPLRLRTNDANHLIVDFEHSNCQALCDNAAKALRFLAERRVQIVLFPEAVVPDEVVERLKRELRQLTAEGSDYPALVLAGTFERTSPTDDSVSRNEAIILNSRGLELWRQSKMHPYGMQGYEQTRYGLNHIFKGTAVEPVATHTRQLVFCDSRLTGARMVVAICEDSAQDDPCLHAVRGMQPNLVMIPVMAGALLQERGFALTVGQLTRRPGTLTTVTNSAALARAEWRKDGKNGSPPLGIVGIPRLNYVDSHQSVVLLSSVHRIAEGGPDVLIYESPS